LDFYTGDGSILISGINWIGTPIKKESWESNSNTFGWLVSPWQRSGSLINDFDKKEGEQTLSKLKHNRLINTRVSYETDFSSKWTPPGGIGKVSIFNTEDNSLVYL
jgi:hypothetical protein